MTKKLSGYSLVLIIIFVLSNAICQAQKAPANFHNPIIPGFSPDPSICRNGTDYYLVNSSFVWFPGIPIYHSKDLVNWKLIGHAITRPSQLKLDGVDDKNGIWAVTIRYHDGLFYLVGTASHSGGNFYMTAKNPSGDWSDPVWLKDAPGIDGSLFWDDDGRCYYTGNDFGFKKAWPSQCQIWLQELDLKKRSLVGERFILTYGHANNAASTEGPHLYKVNGKYLLITAEGGTDYNHAITAHHSNNLTGPYVADKINPVLSHRQLGKSYPIQAVGHGDLVQTQNGDWWAVALGKRVSNGNLTLTRETFLCKVDFEDGTPIFNPGYGKVLTDQSRPNLPWTPVKADPARDNFKNASLAKKWHFVRIPKNQFYDIRADGLHINLLPEVADSLKSPAMIIQKITDKRFEATTKISFKTSNANEQAGLILYRNAGSYIMLMKDNSEIKLITKTGGNKSIIASAVYKQPDIYLKVVANGETLSFSYGPSLAQLVKIGDAQNMHIIGENQLNRFNGPGVGIYASSNGATASNGAKVSWFEYQNLQ